MSVTITWMPNTEPDIAHYDVQRAPDDEGTHGTWIDLISIDHSLTGPNFDPTTSRFFIVDMTGTLQHWYRLRSVDTDNNASGYRSLYSNNTGSANNAVGFRSLYSNTEGEANSAAGFESLYLNTTGDKNTANGYQALYSNKAGSQATAIGTKAMYYSNNTYTSFSNHNVAVGYEALRGSTTPANNTGNDNTALGYQTLYSNTSGDDNTANGRQSLYSNTSGDDNTAFGIIALYNNVSGNYNTALGGSALNSNTTGDNNTAIGYNAYYTNNNLDNTTCIGYSSGGQSNVSNRIEIGNTSVSWIGGQVTWDTYSDKRIKKNIQENVPGLDFINRLRPVTYNLDIHKQNNLVKRGRSGKDEVEWDSKYDIERKQMTGFIAQEVELAAKESGYDFSGVEKADDDLSENQAES